MSASLKPAFATILVDLRGAVTTNQPFHVKIKTGASGHGLGGGTTVKQLIVNMGNITCLALGGTVVWKAQWVSCEGKALRPHAQLGKYCGVKEGMKVTIQTSLAPSYVLNDQRRGGPWKVTCSNQSFSVHMNVDL